MSKSPLETIRDPKSTGIDGKDGRINIRIDQRGRESKLFSTLEAVQLSSHHIEDLSMTKTWREREGDTRPKHTAVIKDHTLGSECFRPTGMHITM